MKSNHIPRVERLKNRISMYESRIGLRKKIGKGNPYYKCSYCGQAEPQISISGHMSDCPEPGYIKQRDYYKKLLAEELSCISVD
jgi:hypothetical protein